MAQGKVRSSPRTMPPFSAQLARSARCVCRRHQVLDVPAGDAHRVCVAAPLPDARQFEHGRSVRKPAYFSDVVGYGLVQEP